MILAKELAKVLDNLPESVELLSCKFEFGDRPPVTVHVGDRSHKIMSFFQRQTAKETCIYTAQEISDIVCKFFGVTEAEIKGRGRYKSVARARQVLCYLLRKHTKLCLSEIGLFLGYADHTTVMHHINRVSELIAVKDAQTSQHVEHIENTLATLLYQPLPTP